MEDKTNWRKDYLDGKITFKDYYRSLYKACGISFKDSRDLLRLAKSLTPDGKFNGFSLGWWDNLAYAGRTFNRQDFDKAFRDHGDAWSLAGGVCMLKQAARDAVEESKGV